MDMEVPSVDVVEDDSTQHPLYFLRTHSRAGYPLLMDPVNNSQNAQIA